MVASFPQAVQSCHELLLWLIPQLDQLVWLVTGRLLGDA